MKREGLMPKYIFVTGGVVSGLGKGITAASLGRLLKERGLKVTLQKCDPYLNVDPGTMSPYQHGEVFVTSDGAETDLDLGHYERFIDEELNVFSNVTTGKIYQSVINKERKGDYLGGTVQVIPHITNEIKSYIYKASETTDSDVIITEIGGTVGDIESTPFLEAIRQVKLDKGRENVMYIHVTLVPYLTFSDELKTKPTQHSVKELRSIGIEPDMLVLRSDYPLDETQINKLAMFCNVDKDCLIQNLNVKSLYAVPLMLEKEGIANAVCRKLNINCKKPDLREWNKIVEQEMNPQHEINLAIVGKYVGLHDAYLSVVESINHAGTWNRTKVNIMWLNSEDVNDDNAKDLLEKANAIIVPGGFGDRGIEGKICAIKYARTSNTPFLGICLGMQLAVVEFSRNVLGLKDAHSSEFANTTNPVIHIMDEQLSVTNLGGTMRLGNYPCYLKDNTLAKSLYKKDFILERHRHRYEFNNKYRDILTKNGMVVAGTSKDDLLVEIIELKNHPYFIASQFHPEFKSRPNRPHPLFYGLVKAGLEQKAKTKKN